MNTPAQWSPTATVSHSSGDAQIEAFGTLSGHSERGSKATCGRSRAAAKGPVSTDEAGTDAAQPGGGRASDTRSQVGLSAVWSSSPLYETEMAFSTVGQTSTSMATGQLERHVAATGTGKAQSKVELVRGGELPSSSISVVYATGKNLNESFQMVERQRRGNRLQGESGDVLARIPLRPLRREDRAGRSRDR